MKVDPHKDGALERRATEALRRAVERVPSLRFVAARAKVRSTSDARTVDVSPEAKIRVNPAFAATLDDTELEFVMAHELMHLLLRTHERQRDYDPRAFNWAHDAVINDTLAPLYGGHVPGGGVVVEGARLLSAEALLQSMAARGEAPWEDASYQPDVVRAARPGPVTFPHRMRSSGSSWESLKVSLWSETEVTPEIEARLAPRLDHHRVSGRVRAERQRALSGAVASLAAWLDARVRAERSYARPSRRGNQGDVVLKGRSARPPSVTVLLDVSSSMVGEHGRLLGLLQATCAATGVAELRLVQADHTITSDTLCEPSALSDPLLEGSGDIEVLVMPMNCDSCGGRHGFRSRSAPPTELGPAIAAVAMPGSSLVVVTDGIIANPGERPRGVDVAWVVCGSFRPAWGHVVRVEPS